MECLQALHEAGQVKEEKGKSLYKSLFFVQHDCEGLCGFYSEEGSDTSYHADLLIQKQHCSEIRYRRRDNR